MLRDPIRFEMPAQCLRHYCETVARILLEIGGYAIAGLRHQLAEFDCLSILVEGEASPLRYNHVADALALHRLIDAGELLGQWGFNSHVGHAFSPFKNMVRTNKPAKTCLAET